MRMDKSKPDDASPEKKSLDPRHRRAMINDLENLSGILDDDDETPQVFDDLPVLKSFVDPATLTRGKNTTGSGRSPASVSSPRTSTDISADPRKRYDPSLGGSPLSHSPIQSSQLRQRTAALVDELVAAALPRLEAELRARLEREAERLLRPDR